MPAGVSWPRYIAAASSSLFAMMLGSQTVHSIYRPMKNFDQLVEEEKEKMRIEAQELNPANLQENRREISDPNKGGDNSEKKNSIGDNSNHEDRRDNTTKSVLDTNANEERKKVDGKGCENVPSLGEQNSDSSISNQERTKADIS